MRPNKRLFFDVLKRVARHCESEGFVEHPAYVSAWEPSNQMYEATLIRSDVSEYIDQLNVSFDPSGPAFSFDVIRSVNSFWINSLSDLPSVAGDWTDCWLYQPYDQYVLGNYSAWNIFYIDRGFKLSKRKPLNVEMETLKVCISFERNSGFLFDALRGAYRGRSVHVEHYKIERSK